MHYAGDLYFDPVRPPGYPLLINLFMLFDGFPAGAAALVSGVTMIIVLVVFSRILHSFNKSFALNAIFLLICFLFNNVLYIFKYAWSEVPFVLFIILNIFFLYRHHETGRTKYYTYATVFTSLAVITRYMGYALMGALFIYTVYFLYNRRKESKGFIIKYLLLNSISYLPVLVFIIRNFIISKTFHGSRIPTTLSGYANISEMLKVLENNLSVYFIILAVPALVVYGFFIGKRITVDNRGSAYMFLLSYILIFVFLYISMVIYTTSTVKVDPISIRYLAPLYPLFFLFVAVAYNLIQETLIFNKVHKLMVSIFFYSFSISVLLVHLNGFSNFMNNIVGNQHKASNYLSAGYEKSPALMNINTIFKTLLKKRDSIYVYAIHETLSHANYPHLARTIFFRRGVIDGQQVKNISFQNIRKPDFTVDLLMGVEKKQMHFRNLPKRRLNKKFFMNMVKKMVQDKCEDAYLLTTTNYKLVSKKTAQLGLMLPSKLKIKSRQVVGFFVIYHLSF